MEHGKNRFFNICEAYKSMLGKKDSMAVDTRRYNAINESLEGRSSQNIIDMWCEAFKNKVCIIVGGYGLLCYGDDGLYGVLSMNFLDNSENYGARWIEEELSAVKIFDSISEAKSFLSEIPQMSDGTISEEWKHKYFPGTYIENVNEMKPIRIGDAIGGKYGVGESTEDDFGYGGEDFSDGYDDSVSPEINLARSDTEAAKARGEYYLIGYPYSGNEFASFLFSSKSKDEAIAYAKDEFSEGEWDCINVCDPEGYIVKSFENNDNFGESTFKKSHYRRNINESENGHRVIRLTNKEFQDLYDMIYNDISIKKGEANSKNGNKKPSFMNYNVNDLLDLVSQSALDHLQRVAAVDVSSTYDSPDKVFVTWTVYDEDNENCDTWEKPISEIVRDIYNNHWDSDAYKYESTSVGESTGSQG